MQFYVRENDQHFEQYLNWTRLANLQITIATCYVYCIENK